VTEKVTEKVTENQFKILNLVGLNKFITIEKISKEIKISSKSIKENIKKLKQKNLIERIGPDKGGYWKIIKKNVRKKK